MSDVIELAMMGKKSFNFLISSYDTRTTTFQD